MLNVERKAFWSSSLFCDDSLKTTSASLLTSHPNCKTSNLLYIAEVLVGTQLALPTNHQNIYRGDKLGMIERLDKLKTDS